MKISEKLDLFKKQRSLGETWIDKNVLLELEIRQSTYLANCIFEKGVNISSPIISSAIRTFFGAYSYINDGGYLRANVFVGRYCSIGRRVSLGAGTHAMSGLSTSPRVSRGTARPYSEDELLQLGIKHVSRPFTVIMNDVWIGDGSVVVPGVTVGTGAVIGANSVVVRDVAPYSIVAGSPARAIRFRFPDDIIVKLLNTEWWEHSDNVLQKCSTGNVFEFIESFEDQIGKNEVFSSFVLRSSNC